MFVRDTSQVYRLDLLSDFNNFIIINIYRNLLTKIHKFNMVKKREKEKRLGQFWAVALAVLSLDELLTIHFHS
jgi:hypothetical protein